MHAIVTTDGSCYPNDGTGNGGWAAIIRIHGTPAREISGALKASLVTPLSNNIAELTAVLEALRALPQEVTSVLIRTDSQYVKNCCTIWFEGWVWRGWVTSTGDPVKNKALIEAIMEEIDKRAEVQWVHIRGHNGDAENERCDVLAAEARRSLNT